MKTLAELIDKNEPGIDLILDWTKSATNHFEILPPSPQCDAVLLETQVTTRSPMGAVAHETGGILIDHGWLRFLGSGHPKLPRTLPGWNQGKSNGLYLIADDAAGGFYALNGGALGDDQGNVYFWSPDNLEWKPLDLGYSEFLYWALTGDLAEFYTAVRWETWQSDIDHLSGDRCIMFFPFLWTTEGSAATSQRGDVPVAEAFALKCDLVKEFGERGTDHCSGEV